MKPGRKRAAKEKGQPGSLQEAILGRTDPNTEPVLYAIASLLARPVPKPPMLPTGDVDPLGEACITWPDPGLQDLVAPHADACALSFLRDATPSSLRALADALEARPLKPSLMACHKGLHPRPVDPERFRLAYLLREIPNKAYLERYNRAVSAWRAAWLVNITPGKGTKVRVINPRRAPPPPKWGMMPEALDAIARGEKPHDATIDFDKALVAELCNLNRPAIHRMLEARGAKVSIRILRDTLGDIGWKGKRGRPWPQKAEK